MTEVVIDVSVAGMDLSQEAKEWLYENCRDKFFGRIELEPVLDERTEPIRLDEDRFEWDWECDQLWDEATQSWWYFNENGTLGNTPEDWDARSDKDLITAVRRFGGGDGLKIVEIPDDVKWYVDEHEDGSEVIREKHRVWN